MAKYFTHPRKIGLIFSITPTTGWDWEAPKISLSLSSKPSASYHSAIAVASISPTTPDTTELKSKKSETPALLEIHLAALFLIYLHLQFDQLLP